MSHKAFPTCLPREHPRRKRMSRSPSMDGRFLDVKGFLNQVSSSYSLSRVFFQSRTSSWLREREREESIKTKKNEGRRRGEKGEYFVSSPPFSSEKIEEEASSISRASRTLNEVEKTWVSSDKIIRFPFFQSQEGFSSLPVSMPLLNPFSRPFLDILAHSYPPTFYNRKTCFRLSTSGGIVCFTLEGNPLNAAFSPATSPVSGPVIYSSGIKKFRPGYRRPDETKRHCDLATLHPVSIICRHNSPR